MTARSIDMDTGLGRLRITWADDSLVWTPGGWAEQDTSPAHASLDWHPITADYAVAILTALVRREPLPVPPDLDGRAG